jgi:iron complex transport system ATP-binding protein
MRDLLGEVQAVQSAARTPIRAGAPGREVFAAALAEQARCPHAKDMVFVAHGMGLVSHEAPHLTGTGFVPYPGTHEDRPLAPNEGMPPVRVFGSDRWDVFELRSQLGIVSADLHHRFVFGSHEGRVMATAAVLSGFFATQGILRHGSVSADMRRRAAEALDRMGVSHLARRRLDEMSSGEARRVLLARALVTSPRALVLDEPTTGLDLIARHAFMERVRQIARTGTTLILITHHIEEIVPEIERVILLRGGRILASGPKRSVLTSERLSALFDAPISIDEGEGYFYARPAALKA